MQDASFVKQAMKAFTARYDGHAYDAGSYIISRAQPKMDPSFGIAGSQLLPR